MAKTRWLRTNYRVTGNEVATKTIARGAYTPSSPATADPANSYCIFVSTGLVSPKRGIAFLGESQTGMSAKRKLFYAGVTGSYLKFNAMIVTRTGAGYFCVPAATTTYCFTWMAFED
jgi:hypothetical protein